MTRLSKCPLAGWAFVLCAGCGSGAFFPNMGAAAACAVFFALVAGAGLCHTAWRERSWVLAAVWSAAFFGGMAAGSRVGLAAARERAFLRSNTGGLWIEGCVAEVREGESSSGVKRHEMRLADATVYNDDGERVKLRVTRLDMRCNDNGAGLAAPAAGEWWRFRVSGARGIFWVAEERMRPLVNASGNRSHAARTDKKPRRATGALEHLRRGVADRLGRGTGPGDAVDLSIVRALLLGLRGEIPWEVRGFFKNSGTAHLFAVSGLVVGMVAALMMGALRFTRLRLDRWGLVLIPGVLFYGLLTGAAPSAMRACLMLSVYWLAQLPGVRVGAFSALSGTAVLLVAANPVNVLDAGFWMSFTVTAGLVAFTRPVMRGFAWLRRGGDATEAEVEKLRASRRREPVFRRWLRTGFDSLCAVSLTAWVVSAPIGVFMFGQWVPAGVLANMVIVPLTFLVVCAAGLSLGVGLFWTQGAAWVNLAMAALARCMRGTATFFAIKPLGAAEVAWPFGLPGLLAVYALAALAGLWLRARLDAGEDEDEIGF